MKRKELAEKLDEQKIEGQARDGIFCKTSGYSFYNTSNFDFTKLIADPEGVEINFEAYLQGFSSNIIADGPHTTPELFSDVIYRKFCADSCTIFYIQRHIRDKCNLDGVMVHNKTLVCAHLND